ncbi:MAG: hypothetical protein FJ314_01645 [SAR202 cluster bacterium]|nr:hypothetical protein [SAR202 cluster bacterium]
MPGVVAGPGAGAARVTILAGLFAGVMMAMIFLPHLAIVLVFRPGFAGWPRTGEDQGLSGWLLIAGAAATFLFWTALGVAAAVLFSIAREVAPTDLVGIPSLVYVIGVVAIVILAVPWVFLLAPKLWRHALFEFGVFLVIFGVQIPITAAAA